MEAQTINKYCSYCGLETWACGHGGHCYNEDERREWEKNFGKSTDYPGFPKINETCRKCGEPIDNKEFVEVEDITPPVESKFKLHQSCFREMWRMEVHKD